MTAHTPKDVYDYAIGGDSTRLTAALATSSNRGDWFTDAAGWNALHKATYNGHSSCITILLNYGIDELRFTKPVYPGTEMYIRFTCKEKMRQEKKEETDIAKGIVKWLVEMFDDTDELIGIATILTMVRNKEN